MNENPARTVLEAHENLGSSFREFSAISKSLEQDQNLFSEHRNGVFNHVRICRDAHAVDLHLILEPIPSVRPLLIVLFWWSAMVHLF